MSAREPAGPAKPAITRDAPAATDASRVTTDTPAVADAAARDLDDRITTFARRRARAQAHTGRSLWAQATWVGTVGWLVAVPIVLGAFVGHLLDRRLGTGITWAMACMGLGVLVGGYALWRLGYDVREPDDREPTKPKEGPP